MKAFTFQWSTGAQNASNDVVARPSAMFLAGGTTLADLMRIDVLTPRSLAD
jgi:CO/xanthine dehydrogenase FAD-binding subunit